MIPFADRLTVNVASSAVVVINFPLIHEASRDPMRVGFGIGQEFMRGRSDTAESTARFFRSLIRCPPKIRSGSRPLTNPFTQNEIFVFRYDSVFLFDASKIFPLNAFLVRVNRHRPQAFA